MTIKPGALALRRPTALAVVKKRNLCACHCGQALPQYLTKVGRNYLPGHARLHREKKKYARNYWREHYRGKPAAAPRGAPKFYIARAGGAPKPASNVDRTILELRNKRDALNEAIKALETLDRV